MLVEARNVSVHANKKPLIQNVSFTLAEGEWLMLVGANGAGKTTLVRAIAGSITHDGEIFIGGTDSRKLKPREMARQVGLLTQQHSVNYAFTAEEIVRLGRYAYKTRWSTACAAKDEAAVELALTRMNLQQLRGRSVLTMSGGELQRVFLAQVFAQNPKVLLLDEPANHLDMPYQKLTFDLIREWLAEGGRAVVSVAHDLSLAKAYGTHALVLREGHQLAYDTIDEALSNCVLAEAYGMDVGGWMRGLLSVW